MGTDPTIVKTGRPRRVLGALFGFDAPAVTVVQPHIPVGRRIRNWFLLGTVKVFFRMLRRFFWRWRRSLWVWYAAMTVWVAAAVLGFAPRGWLTMLGLSTAGLVPLWRWLGLPMWILTKRRNVRPTVQRIWYAAFYAFLAIWGTVAAAWTPLPPWLGVWWLGTLVVWTAHMWHHRVRPERAIDLTPYEQAWSEVKGVVGTKLYDAVELEDPPRFEAKIDLTQSDLLVDDVARQARHIAKRFGKPSNNVIVDYPPGRVETYGVLVVVKDNKIDEPALMDDSWRPTAQDVKEGCIPFHQYPDGRRGRVRLWTPGAGTSNSLFSGDIRTGKSEGMSTKMTQAVDTGMVWPAAIDPQGGVSMPVWCGPEGRARWQATEYDDILDLLLAFRAGMYYRSRQMTEVSWVDKWGDRHIGINCWDPGVVPQWPALGLAFDEAWKMMVHEEIKSIVLELLKMQNKCGIYMDLATQYPVIGELGGEMSVRQSLTAGNILCYRNTATNVGSLILPDGMPHPGNIPDETANGDHTKGTLIAKSAAPRSSLPVYSRSVFGERGRYWADLACAKIPELEPGLQAIFDHYRLKKHRCSDCRNLKGQCVCEEQESITVSGGDNVTVVDFKNTKVRVLDRVLAFLRTRKDEGQRAHTGVIAQALGSPMSTISQTMKRAEGKQVHQPQPGIWALGPGKAKTAEEEKEAA